MDTFTLSFCFFMLCLSSTLADPDGPPHTHTLENLCKDLKESIDDGTFFGRKKILDDCSAKSLPPDQVKAMEKCRSMIPLETPSDVEKVCSDIKSHEPKFNEARSCFKSNSPASDAKKTFQDCIKEALDKE
ncbi:uncharacterized protein LOC107369672 [Tetranychus urticae]|nr:uncharacterized protein LOC107369672 [Tetranychus urticae]